MRKGDIVMYCTSSRISETMTMVSAVYPSILNNAWLMFRTSTSEFLDSALIKDVVSRRVYNKALNRGIIYKGRKLRL